MSSIDSLEQATNVEALWAETLRGLSALGLPHVIYLSVDSDFGNPLAMTNRQGIYAGMPPEQDPFLSHCCTSYDITRTGLSYLPDYDYLPAQAKDFIRSAADVGFRSGLGIPMRLQGSSRFGGFNVGSSQDREAFEAQIVPQAESIRFYCLIAHRRIEELTRAEPFKADAAFRDLLVAPGLEATRDLSPREREVVYLVARGLSRKESARMCGISPNTVSEYLKSAYRKLGVSNRAEAARRVWGHNA